MESNKSGRLDSAHGRSLSTVTKLTTSRYLHNFKLFTGLLISPNAFLTLHQLTYSACVMETGTNQYPATSSIHRQITS